MGSCFVMESCYPVTSKYYKKNKNHAKTYFFSSSTPTHMYISIVHTKCFNALIGIQATTIYSILQQSRKATVYHSGRDVTIRDVVFRGIKTTPVTQMRGVHIRDKIIKDCILLGSPLTVGMFSSRIVSCLHRYRTSKHTWTRSCFRQNQILYNTRTVLALFL
jgi:hypothetical protein